MNAKLNIETHIAKHDECNKILDMLKRNRNYMLSDMNPGKSMIEVHGKSYFENRVEMRGKIQHRLLGYYLKKSAQITGDVYEVVNALLKNQSPIIQL